MFKWFNPSKRKRTGVEENAIEMEVAAPVSPTRTVRMSNSVETPTDAITVSYDVWRTVEESREEQAKE
jgi:hypothetical protein